MYTIAGIIVGALAASYFWGLNLGQAQVMVLGGAVLCGVAVQLHSWAKRRGYF